MPGPPVWPAVYLQQMIRAIARLIGAQMVLIPGVYRARIPRAQNLLRGLAEVGHLRIDG